MEAKIDKIIEDVSEIKITMAVNTGSLKEHMRRTIMLEKKVEPINQSYKVLGGVVTLCFIVAAIVEILTYFRH